MSIYYRDDYVDLHWGDVMDVADAIPDESVDAIITSPPYYSLRDYGIPGRVWGGDQSCAHEWVEHVSTAAFTRAQRGVLLGQSCTRCGAWHGQLGLEPTVEMYTEHIVDVFARLRRILKPTGTLWMNVGDTYASVVYRQPGVQRKDILGVPWRVAFAMQADGWHLRQDIIWHKPNPMPESVPDRFVKSHEYVFLMARSYRYMFDADASREPSVTPAGIRRGRRLPPGADGEEMRTRRGFEQPKRLDGRRRYRSVWSIPPSTSAHGPGGHHFAAFPDALAARMIAISTPPGGVVLDPFVGTGTVAAVARSMNRRAIGIDASEEYVRMAQSRIVATPIPLPITGEDV